MRVRVAALSLALLLAAAIPAAAEDRTRPCTGFNPSTRTWGDISVFSTVPASCPDDSALMAAERARDPGRRAEEVRIDGTCCPLPAGALTGEPVFADSECPPGFVATGLRQGAGRGGRTVYPLICRRVDSSRYVLSEPVRPAEIVFNANMFYGIADLLGGGRILRFRHRELPLWLRYGALRTSYSIWSEGCVGYPFGSVLTGKRWKGCSGMVFRTLIPVTADEPPIIPPCATIENPLEENAVCRNEPEPPRDQRSSRDRDEAQNITNR